MSHQIQEPIKYYAPARVYYNWIRREEKWIWKRCFQLWTHYLSSSENKAWKKSGPYGIWTHDLCDTGAALY